jgi:hypothetical protein
MKTKNAFPPIFLSVFLVLAAPVEASAAPAPQAKPTVRHFRMGFTGFPHDYSIAALVEAQTFLRNNADILAHHIEGVPWAECLHDKPLSTQLLKEWEGKKAATPKNGKVYLAISPGRGNLKEAEKSLPFPKELAGKPYDDPLVKKAYLDYCRRMVKFFQPDYLAIGIEVNEIFKASPAAWKAYRALHQHVYQELKKENRNLPIFASFTLHGILNERGQKREQMLVAYLDLIPCNDLVAISFYPFIRGGTTDYAGCLAWLNEHFDKFQKPFAFVETGEAAERLQFPKSRQVIAGTPQKQEAYFQALLTFAQRNDTRFVIGFIHRDYDALWEKIKGSAPEVFMAWRDCGLVDEKGNPRPAFRVWRQFFELPCDP